MEEKTTITFNISGGNNQILPNATEAVQNFYGSEFSKSVSQEPQIRNRPHKMTQRSKR